MCGSKFYQRIRTSVMCLIQCGPCSCMIVLIGCSGDVFCTFYNSVTKFLVTHELNKLNSYLANSL